MTEFTLLEIHFEDGSIPVIDGLGANSDEQELAGSAGDDEADGVGFGVLLLGLVALAVGIALARRLLAGDDADIDPKA